MSDEFERIAKLAAIFGSGGIGVRRGIGDDVAVLDVGGPELLCVSTDAQVEDVHFRRAWMTWEDVGYRSMMAAMSDLAACAARPVGAVSALTLPQGFDDHWLSDLARGQKMAAEECGASVVGGNISGGPAVSVTTTVLGMSAKPILRYGAQVGDEVWLAGDLGHAALGLRELSRGAKPSSSHFVRPRARIAEGLAMATSATSAIDISDGLLQDASHVAAASAVALHFERETLLDHSPAPAGVSPSQWLELVLSGGEDYALLVTSRDPPIGFTRVGAVTAGAGVWLDGVRQEPHGFRH